MIQQPNTQLSPAALQVLRADTELGSANFLDRAYQLSSTTQTDFVFLERPFALPDGTTYRALSLETLLQARRRLAEWYVARGVKLGCVVALSLEDGIGPFLHYLALTSLGAAAAIINPHLPADVAAAYVQHNGFSLLVLDATTRALLSCVDQSPQSNVRCEFIDGTEPERFGLLPGYWPYHPADSTLVMLCHTSGTTGVPKAVRFEHRQFFISKRSRIGQFSEGSDERVLSCLPQSHSCAISHLETLVLHGIPTFVLSTPTGAGVCTALREFQPTTVLGFPQTYASLVHTGIVHETFASVRRWFSMGDAAHTSRIKRVLAGAPRSRFIDAFGSSELGMALFQKVSTLDKIAPARCIGRPVELAIAKVLDPGTCEDLTHTGRVGLLAVRAATVTSGYWRLPELTHTTWRNGYFLTGDMVFCRDGEFYLVNRTCDSVCFAGGARYTLPLEEAVQSVAGVCDTSIVMSAPHHGGRGVVLGLVLADRPVPHDALDLAQRVWSLIHTELATAPDGSAVPDVIVAVATDLTAFPLGATGKVLKRKLRELVPTLATALAQGDTTFPMFQCVMDGRALFLPNTKRASRPAEPFL